jgi:DNA repair protein RadD
MKPRDYQDAAVASIWNYFRKHTGNPLVAMPPGTGKSVVIAMFLKSVLLQYANQKILVLTHVKELIQQNFNKMHAVWNFAPAGVYSAGLKSRDHKQPIIFGGIASLYTKAALFGHIDLILIDECHLVSPNNSTMYQAFILDALAINPRLKVIGFTATPYRMGAGMLTEETYAKNGDVLKPLFTDICFDITNLESFNRLIAEGYLAPLVPKPTRTYLDAEGVGKRGGEYIESELQEAVNDDELTIAALEEMLVMGANRRKWLVFATGVDHTIRVTEMLNLLGIKAKCVHSNSEDRDQTLNEFRRGELQAVVNNNVLTTGVDIADIDMLGILRPSGSTSLWVQVLGRGTRPVYGLDGKGLMPDGTRADLDTIEGRLAAIAVSCKQDCLVLDFARNTERLGPINDPMIPESKSKPNQSGFEPRKPYKTCPKCNTYNSPRATHCINTSHCDYVFPAPELNLEKSASELALIATGGDSGLGSHIKMKVFAVLFVTYDVHQKDGSPDMVKVTYSCAGRKTFSTYVCIEHGGFALKKAKEFWARNCDSQLPVPYTCKEMLGRVSELKTPTHLRVWTNKKVGDKAYPEIMAMCYDGSAFGAEEPSSYIPDVNVMRQPEGKSFDLEDDIPF